MQEISDDLIDRFFKGLCTKEEAVKVLDFLKKHPEHPYLLQAWDAADATTALPAHTALEMYDEVTAHISKDEKNNTRLLWRMTAAACVAAIFISLFLLTVRVKQSPGAAIRTYAQQVEWTDRQNTQDTSIVLLMPDKSRVTLSPATHIRYRKDFGQSARRDVYMNGDAFYEVAKNKEKPFTVYSGYISTTALGTAFRVTARDSNSGITVKLLEGKVVVAVTDAVYKTMHHDYYLAPGEELSFEGKDKPGAIKIFSKKNNAVTAAVSQVQGVNTAAGASYMFNNQTLAYVLDQLAAIYHVSIDYSKEDIGEIYFIGRIERGDPVEKTIHDIALLNKLSVTKQNGGFILKRKKH